METKIPFYNIVNMFLTGLVFVGCCVLIFRDMLIDFDFSKFENIGAGLETIITVSFFAIIYEIGYIINRLGSVFVEPFLKKTKIIKLNNDYKKFNECKQKFPILSTLSREYALSRTSIVLFAILAILSGIFKQWWLLFIFIVVMFLFIFSCRKHAKKIVDIMKG